jgi:small basic protein
MVVFAASGIAFGVPSHLTGQSWDWLPLFTTIAAFGIVRIAIGVRFTIPVIILTFVGGLVMAVAIEGWGVALGILASAASITVIRSLVRRMQRREPDS